MDLDEHSEDMISAEPSIVIGIQGINFFAAYIGILAQLSARINLEVHYDYIRAEVISKNCESVADFILHGAKLLKYDTNIEPGMMIVISTVTSKLEQRIKSTSKTMNGFLTMWSGDSNVYFHHTNTSWVNTSNGPVGSLIETLAADALVEYKNPQFPEKPFATIMTSEFCAAAQDAVRTGSVKVRIVPYDGGIYFGMISNANVEIKYHPIGECIRLYEDPDDQKNLDDLSSKFGKFANVKRRQGKEEPGLYIKTSALKPYIKLKNTSSDVPLLRIWYTTSMGCGVLKFSGKISSYGESNFYLRCAKNI
jgi:hypothetical protein